MNLSDILKAPFGVATDQEIPEGTLQGQVGNDHVQHVLHALRGGTDTVKNLIDAAAAAPVGVPTQDMTPEQNQNMDNAVGNSWDTAVALAGRGMPNAEEGAVGIFGGKASPMANIANMFKAEDMRDQGYVPADILKETKWFASPTDQQWKFEIPDNAARMAYFPASGPADAVMQHQALFNTYPQLKQTTIKGYQGPNSGYWSPNENTAYVTGIDKENAKSIGLHELQHAVQGIENFAWGNDPKAMAAQIEKGLRKNNSLASGYDFDEIKNQSHDLYHRTAGEVEARNVQRRMYLSPEDRLRLPPWKSQDVPYDQQLVVKPNLSLVPVTSQDIIKALTGGQ